MPRILILSLALATLAACADTAVTQDVQVLQYPDNPLSGLF